MFLLLLCVAICGVYAVPGNYINNNSTENDSYIVGGEPIDITQAPYQVAMYVQKRFHCGGSIIRPDVVLSAAHCLARASPNSCAFRAGSSQHASGGQLVFARRIVIHPNYDHNRIFSDVAVVKLKKAFILSDSVTMINLNVPDNEVPDGTSLKVTGWGLTTPGGSLAATLQSLNVTKINLKKCQRILGSQVTDSNICAGYKQNKNACNGDSGGPLVGSGVQVGIVSFGSRPCATAGEPVVYAKVSAFRTWIDNTANSFA